MVFTKRGLRTYTRRGALSSQQFDGLMFQEQAFDFKRNDTSSPFTSMLVTDENQNSLTKRTESPLPGEEKSQTNGTSQAKKRATDGKIDGEKNKKKRKYSRPTKAKLKSTKDGTNSKNVKKTRQKVSVPAFEMPEMFSDVEPDDPAVEPTREMEQETIAEKDVLTMKRKSARKTNARLPEKQMAVKDKVRAWMAKSSSPQSIISMDPVDSDSSIEIPRGEKLTSHMATRNQLFTEEFYSNLHKVLSPVPAGLQRSQPHDPRTRTVKELRQFDSIKHTDMGTPTDLTSGISSPPVTGSLPTGTGLPSKYTTVTTDSELQTDTGTVMTDGSDDIHEIHTAIDYHEADLSPIPDVPEPEVFKIPAITAVNKPAEPKAAKFLSSTMKAATDSPYEFPDMSTIPLTESVKQRKKTAEKTPQRKPSFATPMSPSKSQKLSGRRRSREPPKTSTRLFQTECLDVDDTPQLSSIQKSSGADIHFLKSSVSDMIKDLELENNDKDLDVETENRSRNIDTTVRSHKHAPITTSTPNKGQPRDGDMHFEMDISSVSIGSVEDDLQFHHSTREINSAEILHLSDTHIDIQEGQVDGNTGKTQKAARTYHHTSADKDELLNGVELVKKGLKFDKAHGATSRKESGQTKARKAKPRNKSDKIEVSQRKIKRKPVRPDKKVKVSVQKFGRIKYTAPRNKMKKAQLKVGQKRKCKSQIRSSTPCDAELNMPDLVRNLFSAVTPIEKDSLRMAECGRGDKSDRTASLRNITIPSAISKQSARSISSTIACHIGSSTHVKDTRNVKITNGHKRSQMCNQGKVNRKPSAGEETGSAPFSQRFNVKCATPDTVICIPESAVITRDDIHLTRDNMSGFRANGDCDIVGSCAGSNGVVSPDIPDICTLMNEEWLCERKLGVKMFQYVQVCGDNHRDNLEDVPIDDLL